MDFQRLTIGRPSTNTQIQRSNEPAASWTSRNALAFVIADAVTLSRAATFASRTLGHRKHRIQGDFTRSTVAPVAVAGIRSADIAAARSEKG